ncbi:aminoacyl-histidine dipeptidase [Flavobacterium johnsoniae]|uniref:Cytosol non-specific dipeptidase n=1 Tax=Flavobacterium johnsoniae (strain ATCC 17061 / DSM 2064 / JCM 8514 / BCRC 14874 / CCUG 350202 / NBRC 14942 / NCIMB 11054 / UW101) TaxID=376686 RepID=A5FH86_FLAJ1|nr:aminoacyl-histidine dipeptidase [Flavobacterium johnsoniae]ABQ05427.1 aminoacyl-histidine dipeptidase [Flavobacterium johnsoniae UW101]OXE96834.1 aminoacyl-histidine dipeptidase [Flavobacterium johnsoniae UW101]WQG82770.1 aminoacyl-histidine dipeptidase [Flavobacterium johnsoniae UW101]SHL57251.1 dipeptidase D [Flavobacterium johnsoniae]
MSQEIRNLEPKALWNKFADLNAVPRPSKKEERVIEFMKNFGNSLGLETFEDEIRNVIIRKPATPGMENRKPIVMQGHLDMVHQKNADTVFDFDTQGIDMYVDGDWVRARGTTLGADNGLGVATIMAVLESKDIPHPAIEALFTVDEETGMTGALNLKGGILQGQILLNLDTEEDDEIDIGCAGGIDVTATRTYNEEEVPEASVGYTITVKGLNGGHSGMDIHKGLGNANKIMNRLLFDGFENFGLQVSEINGGSLRNAIPRESVAKVIISQMFDEAYVYDMQEVISDIKAEYKTTEPNLTIEIVKSDLPEKVVDLGVQEGIIRAIYAAQNGVYRMSPDMTDLVETSNNIARVVVKDGEILVGCLTRSSVESSKFDLANSLRSAFELVGCEVELSGSYPGWTPNVNSEILEVLKDIYEKQNGEQPKVVACHAGLECGILGTNYPGMDMISFGPTIHGAHSPDERASISSAQKYWKFVLEILSNIPVK